MRQHNFVLIVCFITICLTAQTSKPHSHGWAYDGPEGPSHWGDLNPEYKTCKFGHHQAPIDIRSAQKAALPQIEFHYKATPLNVTNTGHAIQFNYQAGSFIAVGGKRYELRQIHFHHPSEEKIDGKGFDMVAHFVHADAEGQLAVVAVLFSHGKTNPVIQTLWQHIPVEEGSEESLPGQILNAASLLPKITGYYKFDGSLTTPPCSEPVTWFVLKTSVEVSREQADAYAKLYPHNSRPTQPLYGRRISESK